MFLALKEGLGLRVFENRVLRITFGLKREEVGLIDGWEKNCIIIRSFVYSLLNVIRMSVRRAFCVAHLMEKKNTYRILVGTP
jgi:hypothetical protein